MSGFLVGVFFGVILGAVIATAALAAWWFPDPTGDTPWDDLPYAPEGSDD